MESNEPVNLSPPNHEDVLIEYVKEKDGLKSDLNEKDKEIQKLKSKIYDLSQQLEHKKGKQRHKENSSSVHLLDAPGTPRLDVEKASVAGKIRTPGTRRAKASRRKKGKHSSKVLNGPSDQARRTSDMARFENAPEVIDHYLEVAERLPDIKLSVFMEAEKLFYESDLNNDGTIDEDEMEKMLLKQGYLYTNKQLKNIMSQMDINSNNSIDLMEYLTVMEKIQLRKQVNLPDELTKSKLCVVQ